MGCYLPRQATTAAGEVAAHAEERKCSKYNSLPVTHDFIPVAIETSGVMGPQSLHFLRELGRRVGRQTGDPLASSHLFQRLSTAIQRGNSACIMGGLTSYACHFPPFLSRAPDQQYGLKKHFLFEDSSKLHGHINEHVQFEGAHQEINRAFFLADIQTMTSQVHRYLGHAPMFLLTLLGHTYK